MTDRLSCFKAYDIRGRVSDELNEGLVYRIGRAFVEFLSARRVVVGRDIRPSSSALCSALTAGLSEGGADVIDIGLCGTEEIYFATSDQGFDGGIVVTGSHNPGDYNGLKLVREDSRPISADSGLKEIHDCVLNGRYEGRPAVGGIVRQESKDRYIEHLLTYVELDALKPLKIVTNAGNGGAGLVIDLLEKHLPFDFVKVNNAPDGTFPNGIPNPLLPERRAATANAVAEHAADLGLAWDGDFDRCFFFDEKASFVEGYYVVGLLGEAMLRGRPGQAVVYDPRLIWNTVEQVKRAGGRPVLCKSGHAFIKQKMRDVDAVYGGEMSAHHYFRDFAYCDSGMIPWLLVCEELSRSGRQLSELLSERIRAYPCSGEINFQVDDAEAKMEAILDYYRALQPKIDLRDGIGVEFPSWRFNLRSSNTEPLLRLNVEARGDRDLIARCTDELRSLIMG